MHVVSSEEDGSSANMLLEVTQRSRLVELLITHVRVSVSSVLCALLTVFIIIIITTTMFMVLSSWPKSLREFTRFIWWMQTERRVAANPQTKPINLGCESAENWQLPSTSTIAIVIITQPVSWYSVYRPTKGGRLSQPIAIAMGKGKFPPPVTPKPLNRFRWNLDYITMSQMRPHTQIRVEPRQRGWSRRIYEMSHVLVS